MTEQLIIALVGGVATYVLQRLKVIPPTGPAAPTPPPVPTPAPATPQPDGAADRQLVDFYAYLIAARSGKVVLDPFDREYLRLIRAALPADDAVTPAPAR